MHISAMQIKKKFKKLFEKNHNNNNWHHHIFFFLKPKNKLKNKEINQLLSTTLIHWHKIKTSTAQFRSSSKHHQTNIKKKNKMIIWLLWLPNQYNKREKRKKKNKRLKLWKNTKVSKRVDCRRLFHGGRWNRKLLTIGPKWWW